MYTPTENLLEHGPVYVGNWMGVLAGSWLKESVAARAEKRLNPGVNLQVEAPYALRCGQVEQLSNACMHVRDTAGEGHLLRNLDQNEKPLSARRVRITAQLSMLTRTRRRLLGVGQV